MEQISFRLEGGPSDRQLERMYEKVKYLLRTVGMTVGGRVAGALAGKSGMNVVGGCVRLDPKLVDECVARAAAQPAEPRRAEWELELLSSYPIYHYDFRSREILPMDTSSVVELTKLTDGLLDRGVIGSTPGVPQDVPPALRHLKCLMIGAEYSRFGPDVPVSSPETADWMLPMLEVVGAQPEFGVFILNPLRCEGDTLDTLIKYPGRFPRITVGSMPMMGVSAPMDFTGATLIGLAGALGALAVSMAFAPDSRYLLEPRIWPVDFHTLNILYGWPETEISTLWSYRFLRKYGLETGGTKAFHSSAIEPDAQANGQRGACGLIDALNGVRTFTFGGLLGTDLVFSAQQLLFDLELVSYYRKVCEPVAFDPEAATLDIEDAGPAGSYLERDSTLEHFRDVWRSPLWNANSVAGFRMERKADLLGRAREEIERIIARHSFRLEEEKLRALQGIYARAEARLA